MPFSKAWRMAAIDSLSSCGPHENAHPAPPMAQAPTPMGVISRSLLPSLFLVIETIIYIVRFRLAPAPREGMRGIVIDAEPLWGGPVVRVHPPRSPNRRSTNGTRPRP